MKKTNMKDLGLTDKLMKEAAQYPNLEVGRISSQHKDLFTVITTTGEITAEVSGKFRYNVNTLSEYPAVGDFIMVDRTDSLNGSGIIHFLLTRKSAITRKVAGKTNDLQIIASNIDTVFICMSLNNDFNIRRLERYLAIAWDSGGTPVVVLTKSDLCEDINTIINEIALIAIGVDVLVTSSILNDDGYEPLKSYLSNGQTAVFIGSSGVGKSTLINRIFGVDILETNMIRNDDKGRHTTTRRELIILPSGGIVIDTPGMRELGIINADLSKTFSDIDELAINCVFRDCTHRNEPNCAVQKAINTGVLPKERFDSYLKLLKEAKYEGMDSKMIEKEKINEMFKGVGGIKNARKFIKEKHKKRF
jgi:ribosome biogenesis GTPase